MGGSHRSHQDRGLSFLDKGEVLHFRADAHIQKGAPPGGVKGEMGEKSRIRSLGQDPIAIGIRSDPSPREDRLSSEIDRDTGNRGHGGVWPAGAIGFRAGRRGGAAWPKEDGGQRDEK
jgi:hypothetical protein